jgi:mono/diheme cytochrome c family protein
MTKDGAAITGTLLNEEKYSLQILDSKDRLVSIQRSSLSESAIIEKGIMPPYKDRLTSKELADIVSYLVSLKGVELP